MGISPSELVDDNTPPAGLGEWYANIFTQSRRRGMIFVNAPTLYSFVEFGVTKAALKNLGAVVTNGLSNALQDEGFETGVITELLEGYQTICYGKTVSRQVLGNMNDLVNLYKGYIEYNGGLSHCNLSGIIKTVNRTPQKNLGRKDSIERLKEVMPYVLGTNGT